MDDIKDDIEEVKKPKENRARDLQVGFRLDKTELEQFEYLCSLSGLSGSALLRRMIMLKRIPVVDTATAVNEMRRQGGLLKHIWLESGKKVEHEEIYAKGEILLNIAKRLERELLK